MKIVKKEWGTEKWIINSENPSYCGKKLLVKRGYQVSFHKHKEKDEVFYLNRGKLLMKTDGRIERTIATGGGDAYDTFFTEKLESEQKWMMKFNDSVHIFPNTYHSFVGLTDAEVYEFSSHHNDNDTYRKDKSGKSNLREAYDYDGTITAGLIPKEGLPIITSRTFEEIDRINPKILKENPIYFNPITYWEKTEEKAIAWKAEIINRLNIEVYYEDSPKVILALQKLCPNCHIEKVGEIPKI